MTSNENTPHVKALIDEGIDKTATEIARMADRATEVLLRRVEQPGDLGDPRALKEALFSAVCR